MLPQFFNKLYSRPSRANKIDGGIHYLISSDLFNEYYFFINKSQKITILFSNSIKRSENYKYYDQEIFLDD